MKYGYFENKGKYLAFVPNDLYTSEYIDSVEKEYATYFEELYIMLNKLNTTKDISVVYDTIKEEIEREHYIKQIIEGDKYKECQLDVNINNYFKAIDIGSHYLENNDFDEYLVCYLHSILLGKNEPSAYRQKQNWYGKGGIDTAELVFSPPEMVKSKMNDLLKYINSTHVDTIVHASIAHLQFESIHPFGDGNGRLGRLLMVLIMYKDGIINNPYIYLGGFLKHYIHRYHESEMKVRMNDEWNDWFGLILLSLNSYIYLLEKRGIM